jgi:serine phosphatase RsbU (regulator of sigma subunit)
MDNDKDIFTHTDEQGEYPACLIRPRLSVLLVDDKAMIGKLVGRMLKSQTDIDFHFCQTGDEAKEKAKKICPTVILQDLVMPDVEGLEMVTHFRAERNTQRTPLIVLSAEEDAKVKADAFALGANDYIVKLPDKLELIARIRYHSEAYIHMLQRDGAYEALRESKKRAEAAREAAEEARKKIMDSIHYAKMIQRSLLPNPGELETYLPDSFVIWMPRDIVGGDIFFTHFYLKGFVTALIDCTGHGIPGAFMTIIAASALKRIVKDDGCCDPAQILKRLNFIVKTTLKQDTGHAVSDDGLDAAICAVKYEFSEASRLTEPFMLTFAGAKMPLIWICNGKAAILKGDRQSIGYKQSERFDINFNFTNHRIKIERGMSFYMFTDGLVNQLGGNLYRPFSMKRFKSLLEKNRSSSFEAQRKRIIEAFNDYKGENETLDDVTVMGFGFR